MRIWVIRTNKHGENEQKYIQEKRVYVAWHRLTIDIAKFSSRDALLDQMAKLYPDYNNDEDLRGIFPEEYFVPTKEKLAPGRAPHLSPDEYTVNRLRNWVWQIWQFAHGMNKGDWVIMPLKQQPTIYIGEITGDYHFEATGESPFFHWRSVKWIGEAIPRDNFAQDRPFLGGTLTISRLHLDNAEARIIAMQKNGWEPEQGTMAVSTLEREDADTVAADLEEGSKWVLR